MSAREVLELQAGLRRACDDIPLRAYLGAFLDRWTGEGDMVQILQTGKMWGESIAEGLDRGQCYSVSADTNALLRRAATDLPHSLVLEEHTAPSAHGFLVFDQAYELMDIHGQPMLIKAITWITAPAERKDTPDAVDELVQLGMRSGGVIIFWASLDDPDYYAIEAAAEHGLPNLRKMVGGQPLVPAHWIPLPIGVPFTEWPAFAQAKANGLDQVVTAVMTPVALWLLCRQPMLQVGRAFVPPKKAREWRRRGLRPQVTTIRLGAATLASATAAGAPGVRPEWAFRWPVIGHWRRFHVGQGRARVEWRYVQPYEKGNPDGPLVVRQKVRRLAGPRELPHPDTEAS